MLANGSLKSLNRSIFWALVKSNDDCGRPATTASAGFLVAEKFGVCGRGGAGLGGGPFFFSLEVNQSSLLLSKGDPAAGIFRGVLEAVPKGSKALANGSLTVSNVSLTLASGRVGDAAALNGSSELSLVLNGSNF